MIQGEEPISDLRIEVDEGDDDRPDFFPALLRRQGAVHRVLDA